MRKTLAGLLFALAFASPAMAAPCGPTPALPDTERRTEYTGISAQTGPFSVGFQLYGDLASGVADYGNWLEAWVNGVKLVAGTDFTVTSPSGPLTNLCLPITDAQVTFIAAQTGTIEIVGARRPRRASQFSENAGVPARSINQVVSDMEAQLRERWDRERRLLRAPPGDSLAVLPLASARAGGLLGFDIGGNPIITNTSGLPISPQSANTVFAGPSSGGVAVPTFRALTTADIATALSGGTLPFTSITGVATAAQLPAGVPTNTLNTQTANYTVATTDCGKTIQLGTGSTGFFTLTVPAVTGFATTCSVAVVNGDTTRGKLISGLTVPNGGILWPKQTISFRIVNGAWAVVNAPGRWKIPSAVTFNVNGASGSDSNNDCLGTGSGACAHVSGALSLVSNAIDFGNVSTSCAATISVPGSDSNTSVSTEAPFTGSSSANGGSAVCIDGASTGSLNPATSSIAVTTNFNGNIRLQNLTINVASGGTGAVVHFGGRMSMRNVTVIGAAGAVNGIFVSDSSFLDASSTTMSFGGVFTQSTVTTLNDSVAIFENDTVNVVSNLTTQAFITSEGNSTQQWSGATISTGAFVITGAKFALQAGGRIQGNSDGTLNFFPGSGQIIQGVRNYDSLPYMNLADATYNVFGTLAVTNGGTGATTIAGLTAQFSSPVLCDIISTSAVTCNNSGSAANNGTYTTPSGAKYLIVEQVGGGGGGGGSGATAGAATAGGNTTFGSAFLTANGGGLGATGANSTCAGGTASGGDVNLSGAIGGYASNGNNQPGGQGGSSFFGGGAGGTSTGAFVGNAAVANSGSGGGGASSSGSAAGSGGGGCAGAYVRKLVTSPSATYAYAVGAAGAAGTAGTSGANGGAGSTGHIVVTAYFQ